MLIKQYRNNTNDFIVPADDKMKISKSEKKVLGSYKRTKKDVKMKGDVDINCN